MLLLSLLLPACRNAAEIDADAYAQGCHVGTRDGGEAADDDVADAACCDRDAPDVDLIDEVASGSRDAYATGYATCWAEAYDEACDDVLVDGCDGT